MKGDNWHTHMVALAEKTAADLTGTCQNEQGISDEISDAFNDSIFCARLDELVFCCTACGWWCDQDECNDSELGEWICDDCKQDEK